MDGHHIRNPCPIRMREFHLGTPTRCDVDPVLKRPLHCQVLYRLGLVLDRAVDIALVPKELQAPSVTLLAGSLQWIIIRFLYPGSLTRVRHG